MSEIKKDWFIVQTLTGQEQKVQKLIAACKGNSGLDEHIGVVLMPTERITSVKKKKKTTITKKLFPGYLFIEAAVYKEGSRDRNDDVFLFIKGIDGIIGFAGGDHPKPMTTDEVANVRGIHLEDKEKGKPKIVYEPGQTVKIIDGPFLGNVGIVQATDSERGRLTVMVSIFGGSTPLDLENWQVEAEDLSAAAAEG
jgi:Transcription antiterminator